MTGPDGQSTKRDQRREARRQQLQRQQADRQRQRTRQIRQRQARTGAVIAAVVIAVIIIGLLVAHFAFGAFSPASTASVQQHANGQVVDGLACARPKSGAHYQLGYIEMYINGQRTAVPAGIGIVSAQNCRYPVYVPSGEANAVATLAGGQHYVLGNLFDLWGQPLSASEVMGHKADTHHPLTFAVTDASGKLQPYTGDPRGIQLNDHQTIVILYNSPNAQPAPYTNWGALHS